MRSKSSTCQYHDSEATMAKTILILAAIQLFLTTAQEWAPQLGLGSSLLAPTLFLSAMLVITIAASVASLSRFRSPIGAIALSQIPFVVGYLPVKVVSISHILFFQREITFPEIQSAYGAINAAIMLFLINVLIAGCVIVFARLGRNWKSKRQG